MDKKKVLFMPGSFSLAHVGRLISLAESLPSDSYEVVFACEERDQRFIPARFGRRRATSLRAEEFRRRLEKGHPLIDAPFLRRQVAEDIHLLKSLRADLVVGDFRPSLSISASVAGVPYMNVVNAHWSPWSKEPFQVPALLDIMPVQWMGFRFGKKFLDSIIPLVFRLHSRAFNRVRREHGLAALPHDLRGVYSAGDYTAYADLPDLAPTPGAPAGHRHIGPVLWEPDVPLPPWWADLPTDKPLVYLSAGSTGRTDFLTNVLAALADMPVTVAVATAGRTTVAPVAGRVFVAEYLPGLPLCQRAALAINNGGAGGVTQALTAGIPVLGIAANMDQCMVMKPVARSGAGRMVLAGEAKTYAWREVIGELLSSRAAKAAAEALSRRLALRSAPEAFHGWVDQILGVRSERAAVPLITFLRGAVSRYWELNLYQTLVQETGANPHVADESIQKTPVANGPAGR
ncbi:MAG: glycosyl transferase family 1 [Elusimicrobia bacterium]|nr:glycosyl transferase family 1 [Elusimicrobiota bacterium]